MNKLLIYSFLLILASCTTRANGESVWRENWIILVILIIGDIYFWYKHFRAATGGSTKQEGTGTPNSHVTSSTKNVKWYQTGWIVAAILCTACTIYYIFDIAVINR